MSHDTLPAPTAPARSTDPETSHAAYAHLKPGKMQAAMLLGYYRLGDRGGTADEAHIACRYGGGRCYWHRSTDLRDGGFIADTEETRTNAETGVQNQVRVITERGVAEIARLELHEWFQ